MKKLGGNMKSIGKSMTKNVTLPILAIGAGLIKVGLDFDKAKKTIRAGTGATGKDLEKLNKSFKKVFETVPNSMEDTSTAIADLNTRTGATGKTLENLTEQMLDLARVTDTEIAPLIAATTRVFGDWGVATEDQADSLDFLFRTSQTTGIGVDRLSTLIVNFGAPMRELGFNFEEAAALMGKFEKEGVATEVVLAGMKQGLGKLAAAGKDPVEEMLRLQNAIQEAGFTAENKKLAFEIFGQRAGIDMGKAMQEGRFDLEELLGVIRDSPETINAAAKETETFTEKLNQLKNKALLAVEPIGTELLGAAEDLIPVLVDVLEGINGLIKKFQALPKETQANVVKFALLLAAAGPVIGVIGGLIGALGGLVTILSGPVVAVLAGGIAMFTAGFVAARKFRNMIGGTGSLGAFLLNLVNPVLGAAAAIEALIAGWDRVTRAADRALAAIKRVLRIKTPTGPQNLGVFGLDTAVPQMGDGGIVNQPTNVILGDKGPEAAVPLKNGKIPIEGGGQSIIIDTINIVADTVEGGRAAAQGFISEFDLVGINAKLGGAT